jgi:hypothetical protein
MNWRLLILSLPTQNATARMRAWRALKSAGAAVLRDGVYLLPDRASHVQVLADVAADVKAQGGDAHLLATEHDGYQALFDRGDDYARLLADVASCRAGLGADTAAEGLRQARKLRKALDQLQAIDFFAGEAQRQAQAAVSELEADTMQLIAPDEPHAMRQPQRIARLPAQQYRGRVWATRRRPWVDRLASAWLIRRFVDEQARFLWLKSPADCPKKAIGFDFDGAAFSHVGARVTFETLLASFGLETPALLRLGALVHGLDVGGVQPPEAAGIERVLAGMRDSIGDDDQLVLVANGVFEGLLAAFEKEAAA